MSDACERLHAYVDGELGNAEHSTFESHLATCEVCGAELPRLLALLSALDSAGAAAGAPAAGPRLTLINGTGASSPALPAPQPRPPRHFSRRPRLLVGLAGLMSIAAALLLFLWSPGRPGAAFEGVLGPTRGLEARLDYPGAARYRPLDGARGSRAHEAISLEQMVRFERAKDWHGLAVASLLAGEAQRAARLFAQAPRTPQVDTDRAALELADGSTAALERALEAVDRALAASPDHPAALWNRALVLAALDLPLAAALDFDKVTALKEPGWAGEAKLRAEALRQSVSQRRNRWYQAKAAGRRLIEEGAAVPDELTSVTGLLTAMFHDAVRSAPSPAAVEALRPLARALEAPTQSNRLSAYLGRIARLDFRVRKPLADAYRELALGRPLTAEAKGALLKRLEQPGAEDQRMGALVHLGLAAERLEEYRRLAAAAQDPWFAVIAEHEAAKAEVARDELAAAGHRLREALALARRERLEYRAILIEDQLAALDRSSRRLSEAAGEARLAYRDATRAGEWILEMNALAELAAIDQNRYETGLARGYLTELAERSEDPAIAGGNTGYDCARREYAWESLANISLSLLEPGRARAELDRAPFCGHESLQKTFVRSELYRLGHLEEDARLARQGLAALRAGPGGSPGQRALLTHIEANLVLAGDRAAGVRLLRASIAEAGRDAGDLSVKARAYSFSLLAIDAGRAAEFGQVLGLLAEAIEVKRPDRCALAVAVQGERSVVAVADAGGQTSGRYVADRKSANLDPPSLVPGELVQRLRGCDHVAVLARAPLLGVGRLLPADLAWSYLLKAPTAAPASAQGRRLVIANPLTPAQLNLPPLGPLPEEPADGAALVLRGAEATKTRVLAAMREASVIEFHTHGVIANDVSEASYLVLSPEPDRGAALTAAEVARVSLQGSPLVILGACHAATSSRSLEGGLGLSEAFLRAGARAVIASPDEVPDRSAHAFFAAVREQVLRGADPAVAVRDERRRRLAAAPEEAWVSGVVVFE